MVERRTRLVYAPRMTLEVGELAPPFTLLDRERNKVTLESYPGKHLVLAFFPLAFTGG